jgi:hypothetical protein
MVSDRESGAWHISGLGSCFFFSSSTILLFYDLHHCRFGFFLSTFFGAGFADQVYRYVSFQPRRMEHHPITHSACREKPRERNPRDAYSRPNLRLILRPNWSLVCYNFIFDSFSLIVALAVGMAGQRRQKSIGLCP